MSDTEQKPCPWCRGSGVIAECGKAMSHKCPDCGGTGFIDHCIKCGQDTVQCECSFDGDDSED